MEFGDIRAFARVAELSSVSAAARTLGLPKSTVSRSISRLEVDVGATLIDRSTRHLRLTDAGMLFRPYAIRILAEVDEAGTAMDNFAGAPRGTLRVSAPITFAVALVSPMLPAFFAAYPEVRVVLDVENRVIDMPVESADIAIRVGVLPDSDLIARHLVTTEVWTCVSPSYIAAHGKPSCIADLSNHALLAGFDRPMTWSYLKPDGLMQRVDFWPDIVVSDSLALEPILVAGAGIGRLPDFLARPSIARGHLVRLFPDMRGDTMVIHALYASHRSLSAKVRVFLDSLVEQLATARSIAG